MRHSILAWVVAMAFVLPAAAPAVEFINLSFEAEFGPREDLMMWGDHGETFGECYQVYADSKKHPHEAHDGERILLINVGPDTWNGVWQQVPADADVSFTFTAFYMIRDGNLEEETATFMKVEFYDRKSNKIGELEGEHRTADTHRRWIRDEIHGTTPAGTEALRLVFVAGHNAGKKMVEDRIYWDDVQVRLSP